MKKIFSSHIKQIFDIKPIQDSTKHVKLPDIKPDTFEKTVKKVENEVQEAVSDMGNMHFKERKFKLFPEDLEKLKQMPEEERADFMLKLHKEGRYTEIIE